MNNHKKIERFLEKIRVILKNINLKHAGTAVCVLAGVIPVSYTHLDVYKRQAEFNRFTNSPIANYKGEIYNMPFNMNTFSKMWGIRTPEEAKAIIAKQRQEIKGEPRNLEEQAISLVGRDVYEKLVKGYTEKQWGRDCTELPSFIIRRLPVRYTYDNNYFNDLYQGIPVGGYNVLIGRLFEGCLLYTSRCV